MWEKVFLAKLAERGIITDAAEAAGIERSTAYRAKENDPKFSLAWDAAMEDACDTAEREAWRRAVDGVEEPVHYGGEKIDTITRYSDQLLVFILKARRYKTQLEVSGPEGAPLEVKVSATDEMLAELDRIAAAGAAVDAIVASNGHAEEAANP